MPKIPGKQIQLDSNPELGTSDVVVSSQRAIKEYVDTKVANNAAVIYTYLIPAGTPSPAVVTHNLNSYSYFVNVYDNVSKEDIVVSVDRIDPFNVEIDYTANENDFVVLIFSTTLVEPVAGTAGIASAIVAVDNGLFSSNGVGKLGGDLLQSTQISGVDGSHSLELVELNDFFTSVAVSGTNYAELTLSGAGEFKIETTTDAFTTVSSIQSTGTAINLDSVDINLTSTNGVIVTGGAGGVYITDAVSAISLNGTDLLVTTGGFNVTASGDITMSTDNIIHIGNISAEDYSYFSTYGTNKNIEIATGNNTTGYVLINILEDSLTVNSSHSSFAGVEYFADYSANYTNRSLVDKAYVDSVAGGGGGFGDVGEDKFLYDSTYASFYEKNYSVVFGSDNLTDYDGPLDITNPHSYSNALKKFTVQTYGSTADSFIGFKSHRYNGGEEHYQDTEVKIQSGIIDLTSTGIYKFYYDNNQLDQGEKTNIRVSPGGVALTASNMDDSTIYGKVTLGAYGFTYAADYSANFVNRSLVDKEYVDTANTVATETTITTNTTLTEDSGFVNVDSSGGEITITLPATPKTGQQITVFDFAGTAATNNIIISGNGNDINGVGAVYIGVNFNSIIFTFNGTVWSAQLCAAPLAYIP